MKGNAVKKMNGTIHQKSEQYVQLPDVYFAGEKSLNEEFHWGHWGFQNHLGIWNQ